MTDKEALHLALEELENCADLLKVFEAPIDSCVGATMLQAEAAITAIKQALAAPVEPDWKAEYLKSVESGCITLDELREARVELEATNRQVEILSDALAESRQEVAALKAVQPVAFDDWPQYHEHAMGCGLEDRGITDRYDAMRYGWDEALERAWEAVNLHGPLYTTPPAAQRQWVDLTGDEIVNMLPDDDTPMSLGEAFFKFAELVEAKLKEKNAAAQPAAPDAIIEAGESPDYRDGWNDCRQTMLEMLKGRSQ